MLSALHICSIPIYGEEPDHDIEHDDRDNKIEQRHVKGGGYYRSDSYYDSPFNSSTGQGSLGKKDHQVIQNQSNNNPQTFDSKKLNNPGISTPTYHRNDNYTSSPVDPINSPINSKNNYQPISTQKEPEQGKSGQVNKRGQKSKNIQINQSDINKYQQKTKSRRKRRSGRTEAEQDRKFDNQSNNNPAGTFSHGDPNDLESSHRADHHSIFAPIEPVTDYNSTFSPIEPVTDRGWEGGRDVDTPSNLNSRNNTDHIGQENQTNKPHQNRSSRDTHQRELPGMPSGELEQARYIKRLIELDYQHSTQEEIEIQKRQLRDKNLKPDDPIRIEMENHIKMLELELEEEGKKPGSRRRHNRGSGR